MSRRAKVLLKKLRRSQGRLALVQAGTATRWQDHASSDLRRARWYIAAATAFIIGVTLGHCLGGCGAGGKAEARECKETCEAAGLEVGRYLADLDVCECRGNR